MIDEKNLLPQMGRKGVLWYNNSPLDMGAKSKALVFILLSDYFY